MYCSECGTKIDDDSKFCSQCGKKIKQKEERNVIEATDEPLGICLRCGIITSLNKKHDSHTNCEHKLIDIGITEKEYLEKDLCERFDFIEKMQEKYVDGNSEINEDLYNENLISNAAEKAILTQQSECYYEEAMQPKCPTCGSKNIKKIGLISRGLSVGTFGLASNSFGKTFYCENCGYKW